MQVDATWGSDGSERALCWEMAVIMGVHSTSPLRRGEVLNAAPSQASCSAVSAMEATTPSAATMNLSPLAHAVSVVPSDSLPKGGSDSCSDLDILLNLTLTQM